LGCTSFSAQLSARGSARTRTERGEIDPSFVTSHRMPLDDAPHAFDIFNDKEDECLKVVLKTH
jgi:threonine dehydrogenase-like Zn-dependent dehydrogenase